LQKAFNLTDGQLDAELHKYFAKGKVIMKRLSSPMLEQDPKVTLRPLSQAESECLLLNVRVELGVGDTDAKKLLEQVRSKAQHFAGDGYVQVMLGEAEARYGDAARAREILQAQVTSSPDNRTALLDLATLELQSDQTDHDARLAADRHARSLAAKANRLDSNDPEALYLFYMSSRLRRPHNWRTRPPRNRPRISSRAIKISHSELAWPRSRMWSSRASPAHDHLIEIVEHGVVA
jgi:outer membrane translocation and assembly module TamA